MGVSRGLLGCSWLFGRLGALEARNGEKAKNIEKTKEDQRFWPLQAFPGRVSGLSWAPWGAFGESWRLLRGLSGPPAPALGPILGLFRGGLGLSWAPLGQSWGILGPSWGRLGELLGGFCAVLGASSAVLERWKHGMVRRPKTSKKPIKINDFGLFRPSRDASRGSLGPPWSAPGSLESRPKTVLGCLEASWAVCLRSGGFLGASWAVLGRFGGSPGGPGARYRERTGDVPEVWDAGAGGGVFIYIIYIHIMYVIYNTR